VGAVSLDLLDSAEMSLLQVLGLPIGGVGVHGLHGRYRLHAVGGGVGRKGHAGDHGLLVGVTLLRAGVDGLVAGLDHVLLLAGLVGCYVFHYMRTTRVNVFPLGSVFLFRLL
jgi:hypothetical protein